MADETARPPDAASIDASATQAPPASPTDADAAPAAAAANPEAVGGSAMAASQKSGPTTASTFVAENAAPFDAPDLPAQQPVAALAKIELLDDVDLDVKVELGRTNMFIEDVLRLGAGSVVPLDKLAGDPVDIYVNDRLVARGEVLVLNDSFCVRINDILSPAPELESVA